MSKRTYYTALGHFRRKSDESGNTYPVILVNRQEYPVDIQEMTVWTVLNWRLLSFPDLMRRYDHMAQDLRVPERQTLENCISRLQTRGLVASGSGETDIDALYDLLGSLYVVPISESLPLRLATFFKLTLLNGVSVSKAKQLFRRDRPSAGEAQIMALSKQALLSTAELIKCVELGVNDLSSEQKIMDALYNNKETTSDNIRYLMQSSVSKAQVTTDIINLYLRKQIIFERM